jgi:hypothetical protein
MAVGVRCVANTIMQWQIAHVVNVLLFDADKHYGNHYKKYKEYPQREDQVCLVGVNVFCKLLKHDGNYLLAVLLALMSVPNRCR